MPTTYITTATRILSSSPLSAGHESGEGLGFGHLGGTRKDLYYMNKLLNSEHNVEEFRSFVNRMDIPPAKGEVMLPPRCSF